MNQCPGGGGSLAYSITAPSGWQIVSCGWQNGGSATDLYASQCFVGQSGASAFIQLVNTSFTPTNTWAWCVVTPLAGTDASAEPAVDAKVTIVEGKKT